MPQYDYQKLDTSELPQEFQDAIAMMADLKERAKSDPIAALLVEKIDTAKRMAEDAIFGGAFTDKGMSGR